MSKKHPNPQKHDKEHNFVMLTRGGDKKEWLMDVREYGYSTKELSGSLVSTLHSTLHFDLIMTQLKYERKINDMYWIFFNIDFEVILLCDSEVFKLTKYLRCRLVNVYDMWTVPKISMLIY